VGLLRQVEVAVASGKTTAQASKEAFITEQTYYGWRKEYGGLQVDQARRLKELEQESLLERSQSDLEMVSQVPRIRHLELQHLPARHESFSFP
jgi:putative transposase